MTTSKLGGTHAQQPEAPRREESRSSFRAQAAGQESGSARDVRRQMMPRFLCERASGRCACNEQGSAMIGANVYRPSRGEPLVSRGQTTRLALAQPYRRSPCT